MNTKMQFVADDMLSLGDLLVIIDKGSANYDKYKNSDHVLYMQKGSRQVNAYIDLAK